MEIVQLFIILNHKLTELLKHNLTHQLNMKKFQLCPCPFQY